MEWSLPWSKCHPSLPPAWPLILVLNRQNHIDPLYLIWKWFPFWSACAKVLKWLLSLRNVSNRSSSSSCKQLGIDREDLGVSWKRKKWEARDLMFPRESNSAFTPFSGSLSPSVFTMCFWCFDIWGPADTGETAPPRVSQLLGIVNHSPASKSTSPVQTNQCTAQTPTTFIRPLQSWVIFPCPNLPKPGTRQLGTVHTPQNLPKGLELARPKPAYLAVPVPFYRNHNKALAHVFPSLLPPDQPWCFPVWPCVAWLPLPLGNCNTLSLQWQLSLDLLPSPYLNNNSKPSTF